MKGFTRSLLTLTTLVFASTMLFAQSGTPAAPSGFRADLLSDIDYVSGKLVDLAGAIPAEKYSWRPGEGVRSVSEVFMHISGANYYLPKFIGIEPPTAMGPEGAELEKTVTEKTKVIDSLKQSVDYLRQVVTKTADADLDKPADFFGHKVTVRFVLMTLDNHLHEHLGQSIAYARMNGIVPPWTAKEQQASK